VLDAGCAVDGLGEKVVDAVFLMLILYCCEKSYLGM
jgi:hypothetical protein